MGSDQDANTLREISGYSLDIEDCRRLLKISNNDLDQATNKLFDMEPGNLTNLLRNSEAKWDETAFGGASYGHEDANVPTFNIDFAPGMVGYPHSTGHSRAPTRPPSRTSQRSILSTHAGDAPIESIESMQESGIVGGTKSAFGPATKESYDTDKWAMVQTATEVIADSIPSQRQREPGQPAILKPSPNFNYLPALIPILHSIPLYRNALLTPAVSGDDYWMGEDWWKGTPSPPSRVIDASIGLAESQKRDIVHEVQRLMAFLDNTDRVYGSVGSLLDLDAWREYQPAFISDPDDDMLKFLLCWSEAYEMMTPNADLNGVLKTVFSVNGGQQNTFLLDGTVTRDSSNVRDIYDVLDETLSTPTGSAHITDIGSVLIFRLTSSTTTATDLGCRIPATLYADRYLEHNKHVIESMRRGYTQYQSRIDTIKSQADRLKWHNLDKDPSKKIESLKLLKTSMTAFEPPTDGSEANPKDAEILAQLQHLSLSIENKLKDLDDQTKNLQKAMLDAVRTFKPIIDDGADERMEDTAFVYPPEQSPQDAMHHPYKLCGVATRRDVVYLQHPSPSPAASSPTTPKQWWRVQYDAESSSPIIRRDLQTLQEVLERATSESASVLLVYATDSALQPPLETLTKPLEDFVKKDNLEFAEELQRHKNWEGFDDDYNNVGHGEWNSAVNDDNHDNEWDNTNEHWETIDSETFQDDEAFRNQGVETVRFDDASEKTLTPTTEMEGVLGAPSEEEKHKGVKEMVEVNGGMDALTGWSRESSATVREDEMDVDLLGDAKMAGAESQHLGAQKGGEVEQRKGG